jgi:hypothetical protein
MTEWKYPKDEIARLAFAANVLEIIKEKNLAPEEVEKRSAAAHRRIDHRVHERAFGRAVRRLCEGRSLSRNARCVSKDPSSTCDPRRERARSRYFSAGSVQDCLCPEASSTRTDGTLSEKRQGSR